MNANENVAKQENNFFTRMNKILKFWTMVVSGLFKLLLKSYKSQMIDWKKLSDHSLMVLGGYSKAFSQGRLPK